MGNDSHLGSGEATRGAGRAASAHFYGLLFSSALLMFSLLYIVSIALCISGFDFCFQS